MGWRRFFSGGVAGGLVDSRGSRSALSAPSCRQPGLSSAESGGRPRTPTHQRHQGLSFLRHLRIVPFSAPRGRTGVRPCTAPPRESVKEREVRTEKGEGRREEGGTRKEKGEANTLSPRACARARPEAADAAGPRCPGAQAPPCRASTSVEGLQSIQTLVLGHQDRSAPLPASLLAYHRCTRSREVALRGVEKSKSSADDADWVGVRGRRPRTAGMCNSNSRGAAEDAEAQWDRRHRQSPCSGCCRVIW
jgi:hypothetical protein